MKKPLFYSLWTLGSLLFFFWLLFPGAFAEALIEAHAHQQFRQGAVDVSGVRPALPLGLALEGLSVTVPALPPVTARDVRLTPSWMTVFTSRPGASLSALCFGGTVGAKVRVGYGGKGWNSLSGQVEAIDLASLSPYLKGQLPVAFTLSGQGQATLALTRDLKVEGSGTVRLLDVVVGMDDPLIPVKRLGFDSVVAEVDVDGHTVTLSRLLVEGTEVDAELRGTLTLVSPMASSRINVAGTVNPDPAFVRELSDRVPLAMLVDPKLLKRGRIPLRISGTLGNPKVSLK